jgi:glycosyltransferase involved in cell wall biosynthesis
VPIALIDISVIVPFHNEREHLARCVRALCTQTFPRDRYEVLLVDNASTDGSAETIRDQPITLLHEPLRSSYAARNLGARHARGRLLAFTDGDCEADPRWLEHLSRHFEDPDLQLLIGERRFARDTHLMTLLMHLESDNARRLTYGYTNNLAVRREVFDQVGPFEVIGRGADTNLFLRAKDRYPGGVRFAPEVSVRHLEVDTLTTHLAKLATYGLVTHEARLAANLDPAAIRLRLPRALTHLAHRVPETARRLTHEHGLDPFDTVTLMALGWANYLAWGAGRLLSALALPSRGRGTPRER